MVDDDPHVLAGLVDFFSDDYDVLSADSGPKALDLAPSQPDIAVAVVDIKMMPMNGIDTARELRRILPLIKIIFYTGYPGEFNEAEIDRTEEPFDYVEKGRSLSELKRAVRNAYESWHIRNRNVRGEAAEDLGMIGSSAKMQEIYRLIYRLAGNDARVLIRGETGTGKELVARALHRIGPRRHGQFGVAPVGGESTDQIRATLFGAVRGAYTGLTYDRTGLMEHASDGVVFIDEVGEFPHEYQKQLLRVIEVGEYSRYGESEPRQTNARIICATHRNLEELVAEGKFREDLYFRIRVLSIELPPLRERKEDILELTKFFLARHTVDRGNPVKYLDPAVYDVLFDYDWPGNVRELENCIEAVTLVGDSEIIVAEDVLTYLKRTPQWTDTAELPLRERVAAFERTAIIRALTRTKGDVTAAALVLGLDRSSLHRKINQYQIDLSVFRETL